MANATRDENSVPTLLGSSSTDGKTPVRVYADPNTHRLLVQLQAGATGTFTSSDGKTITVTNGVITSIV